MFLEFSAENGGSKIFEKSFSVCIIASTLELFSAIVATLKLKSKKVPCSCLSGSIIKLLMPISVWSLHYLASLHILTFLGTPVKNAFSRAFRF